MSLKKIIIFTFFFAPFSNLVAQENTEIDSLQHLINTTKNDSVKAEAYKEIGSIYFYQLGYKDAFFYYSKADSICQQNEALKTSNLRASLYNYLGYSVRVTHGMDKAVGYYQKAKEIYKKTGNEYGVQEVNVGMAQMYTREKEYSKALHLLNESIVYHEKNNFTNQNSYSFAIICRGYLFIQMQQFDLAEKDYKTYYDIAFAGENERLQLFALQYMGYFFKEKKDVNKANYYYKNAIQLAKELGDYETANVCYADMIEMYKNSQNIDSLVKNYQQYIDNRNVLDSINKDKEIYELEAKYQTEKKEQEIALLHSQNDLHEQRRKNQQYLYSGILGLFVAMVGLLLFGYNNKLRAAKKMKELDMLKSRFFENISHEFRTPLTLIKSPVQQLKSVADKSSLNQLNLIDNHADRMLELVDQLLELSKIESRSLKIILKKGSVPSFINSLLEPFVYRSKKEGIPFEVDVQASGKLHYFDRDILAKIIVNLLSNAFKYREGGAITFKSAMANNQLQLEFTNLNKQVRENNIGNIFKRFYQKDSSSEGFGIGLALVQDLVRLYEGTIDAFLDDGKVILSVEIPLENNLKNAVVIEDAIDSNPSIYEHHTKVKNDEAPILLIVDDNPDIRTVLRHVFKDIFNILEAFDGMEAFGLAQNEIPDIIITDVMMSQMDGYTLVKKLKENELTSSIPVLLLTAKASDEAHLLGLEHQANAYLTKPFNHQILKATVVQLIQERKKLQEKYSRELILRPADIAVNTADEKFIRRLETVLNAELTNPDFTSDNFASQMHMSRMQLHRKLKSLFGVSTTEFVRNERLKAATKLLKTTTLSIAEVAYGSGFNEVTYFSKRFKDQYNLSPSAFRQNS